VRPFVPAWVIKNTIEEGVKAGACICAVPVRETLKKIDKNGIVGTVNRSNYILSHTPQVFELGKLIAALMDVGRKRANVTDESMAMEMAGHQVSYTESTPENIKITYSSDIELVEGLMVKYFGNL
jgi:2-C-methyl-D-erythritol 4-phosphate cytidylyltransferase